MTDDFRVEIKTSYMQLRSIYVGAAALRRLTPGSKLTVLIQNDDEFAAEGTLNAQGLLSGMAALYRRLNLSAGSQLTFAVLGGGPTARIVVTSPLPPEKPSIPGQPEPPAAAGDRCVFARRSLRHVHFEPFRAENLNNWEPENETDVYLAFGVLQEYTDFQYCCAASQSVLDRLGAEYANAAKPDAILIDRTTRQYLMAEWKKNSSDFKANHKPDDIDVLVCWNDNETDRSVLPSSVIELLAVARTAAQTALEDV